MHELNYEIVGDDMQAVKFNLASGQNIRAEAGAMIYMDSTIKMDTHTGGGLIKGLKRTITGESFFITSFTCEGAAGTVSFSGPYPGKITPIKVTPERGFLCQKDAYLCSTEGVEVSIGFTKRFGAGLFGGEGFILQKIHGEGKVFLHSGGTMIKLELAPGEEVRVDTGCLVAFSESVHYDIKFVGGVKSALFGGEGLFFATLTGPGKVILQTLPFSRLADKVIAASKFGQEETRRGRRI